VVLYNRLVIYITVAGVVFQIPKFQEQLCNFTALGYPLPPHACLLCLFFSVCDVILVAHVLPLSPSWEKCKRRH
jgi:hypothetical protein